MINKYFILRWSAELKIKKTTLDLLEQTRRGRGGGGYSPSFSKNIYFSSYIQRTKNIISKGHATPTL